MKANYREDFSVVKEIKYRQHFIHEMGHVWQRALGYWVMTVGMLRHALNYDYKLDDSKKLSGYDMEQQPEIIADYFCMKYLGSTKALREENPYSSADLHLYEKVLKDFLANPSDKNNLPKTIAGS
jgi:hypothetical protein